MSPEEWSFGTISAGIPSVHAIQVKNLSRRPVEVLPLSVFENLEVQPAALTLRRGESRTFRLRYDPAADAGEIDRRLIIRARDARGTETRLSYRVGGLVNPVESGPPPEPRLLFHYYRDSGCDQCTVFLVRLLFALQNKQGIRVHLADHDIGEPEELEAYQARLDALGVEMTEYPAIIVGNTVLQGAEQIQAELERLLLLALGRADASLAEGSR